MSSALLIRGSGPSKKVIGRTREPLVLHDYYSRIPDIVVCCFLPSLSLRRKRDFCSNCGFLTCQRVSTALFRSRFFSEMMLPTLKISVSKTKLSTMIELQHQGTPTDLKPQTFSYLVFRKKDHSENPKNRIKALLLSCCRQSDTSETLL